LGRPGGLFAGTLRFRSAGLLRQAQPPWRNQAASIPGACFKDDFAIISLTYKFEHTIKEDLLWKMKLNYRLLNWNIVFFRFGVRR
jgi:hypothetical protein